MSFHDLLAKLLPHRDIVKKVMGRDVLYLRRFYLARTRWGNIFLHYIGRSDDDRFLHDHPWDFTSFILWGKYYEELPKVVGQLRERFSLQSVFAEHTHRVHLIGPPIGEHIKPDVAWTLMITGPARRVWGFHTDEGWKDWRAYLNLPDAKDWPEDVIHER